MGNGVLPGSCVFLIRNGKGGDILSPQAKTYKQTVGAFSREEMGILVQVKRFMECIGGDAQFRKDFEKGRYSAAFRRRLKDTGVQFDPEEMRLLCMGGNGDAFMEYWMNRQGDENSRAFEKELEKAPLLKLWARWTQKQEARLKGSNPNLDPVLKSPRFNCWRQRRIAACKSELGYFGHNIDHPLFAFELSKGCSVGCWFCAFSADRLSAVFEYTPENLSLWRDIAQVGVDLFDGFAGIALCYYATEPYDNPNYLDFVRDYYQITESVVCTATAVPLKNPDWFRSLITFYRENTLPWPRISVLSPSMLKKIHETYTPEELRDVELLMQMRASVRPKARSGRTLNRDVERLGGLPRAAHKGIEYVQGSISCMTGFLVNMVDRTIKLVSPCHATEKWPRGYRVFAEDTFTDAENYRTVIQGMIQDRMQENISVEMLLSFRDDLKHVPRPDGFSLISPNQRHHFTGRPFLITLGEFIAGGDKTFGQIYDALFENGAPALAVSMTVKDLFDQGLLDETVF